jgi:hypothetical protein
MKNVEKYLVTSMFGVSHRYKNDEGEISLITPSRMSNGFYEIYCIKGELFDDIERFDTLEEAENRIEELLNPKLGKRLAPTISTKTKKPILVYLSSSKDVWVSDAYTWMKNNGYVERDFEEVISEKVFWMFTLDGRYNGKTFMFVSERQGNNDYRN